jgi:hypothetical protein
MQGSGDVDEAEEVLYLAGSQAHPNQLVICYSLVYNGKMVVVGIGKLELVYLE